MINRFQVCFNLQRYAEGLRAGSRNMTLPDQEALKTEVVQRTADNTGKSMSATLAKWDAMLAKFDTTGTHLGLKV